MDRYTRIQGGKSVWINGSPASVIINNNFFGVTVATDDITPGLTTNTPTVLSPAIEGTITPDVTTNTPSVLSPLIEGTITPGVTTVGQTVYSPTLTDPTANPIVGYGTNSGGYSVAACYGVSPTTPLYHHPSENAQAGMLLVGKPLYTDAAGTTPISAASTWWSFNKTGAAADRAMQIDGSGNVINVRFQNGVIFGYARNGGNCESTSGFDNAYNAPDDYQFWYPRKAAYRNAASDVLIAATTQALSYSNSGSVIGTATFQMVNNMQHTYLSMTSCGGPTRTKRNFVFIFE